MQALMPKNMCVYRKIVSSPIGECTILATEQGICWVSTPGADSTKGLIWVKRALKCECVYEDDDTPDGLQLACDELSRYFAGEPVTFSCPLAMHGTPFQRCVWQVLLNIPYGETRSYKEIASAIGHPSATRAVGAANGANPIAIIVPCHRVIGSNGTLTGYGGGLDAKQWLLRLEKM